MLFKFIHIDPNGRISIWLNSIYHLSVCLSLSHTFSLIIHLQWTQLFPHLGHCEQCWSECGVQWSLPDMDFSSFRCIPIHVCPCTPMYTLIGLLIGLFSHSWARATLAESEILIHLIWAAGLNVCVTISMFPHVPSPLLPSSALSFHL